jgi:very-short-patch-repair endonuclease
VVVRWGAVTEPAPGVAALGRTPRAGGTMRSHNQKRQARSNLLFSRARSMLHAPTVSEEVLWRALRGGALGLAFKRQVPLGERYIADFFAPSVQLVVEVDGGAHRGSRAADRRRDGKLRRLGYRVVRVEAALVLRDLEAGLAVVRSALAR